MKTLTICFLFLASWATAQVPNGMKTDATGTQVGIELIIPNDSNIAYPHKRTAELLSMIFEQDLNIRLNVRINFYSLSGVPMSAYIEKDSVLSDDQKAYLQRLFAPFVIDSKSTRDGLIETATSQVLSGDPLPGHTYAPELLVYQNLTRAQLQGLGVPGASTETRPMQLVYGFTKLSMLSMLKRAKIIH